MRGHKVRHGRRWSKWLGGAIVTIVVAALCVGIGVAASSALRSNSLHSGPSASSDNGQAAAAAAALAARRSALVAGATVYPANGATNVALDSPIIVGTKRGHLVSVKVTGPGGFPYIGQYTPDGTHVVISDVVLNGLGGFVATVTVPAAFGHYTGTIGSFITLPPFIPANAGFSQLQVAP